MKEYFFKNGTSIICATICSRGRLRKVFAVHVGNELVAECDTWQSAKELALSF